MSADWRVVQRLLTAFVFGLVIFFDVQAAAKESNREGLRREAWVAGQMSAIEKDPRVYLSYQKALTAEIFQRKLPLLNERYVPRLGNEIKQLGRIAWDFAKSDEVDLALSARECF